MHLPEDVDDPPADQTSRLTAPGGGSGDEWRALSLRDSLVDSYSDDDPVPSHARIVDAVRAADPQAAAAAARDLLTKVSDDIARLLEERSR